ncbi:MAG: aminopeptidase [Reichenbachiella sp.]|uniref:aminopeptidase n=1 Tax=Reichenbachiella sp. TaxID=2184521 RepID=UPI002966055D|nr:aminopeptidase [Reichenbachiella sp.]MDW3209228.1 aminopeptidase [Reichenbachiella sp.]
MKKNLKWLILVVGVLFVVSEAQFISYLLMQGQGQLEVLWNARPVDEVLKDSIDQKLREKLLLVEEVKAFAKEDLGLDSEGLYTTVYDQNGEDILWNLTACDPFALQSIEWSFPIVGNVSYKGFFDLEKAKYEEQKLKEKGYDTRIRPVNAWSTLGWFQDPILSNNLERSEGRLAELFIHEITHANIFLKDSLTFNENLASFIGEQGALQFLTNKYGQESTLLDDYKASENDTQSFVKHCLNGVSDLKILYTSFNENMSFSEKVKSKEMYMKKWVETLDSMPFNNPKIYIGRFEEKLPNNAFFMAFERYDSKKESFDLQLQGEFEGDLKAFIKYYVKNSDGL